MPTLCCAGPKLLIEHLQGAQSLRDHHRFGHMGQFLADDIAQHLLLIFTRSA